MTAISAPPSMSYRATLDQLYALQAEEVARREATLRKRVQDACRRQVLTPQGVMAYAGLHLTTDDGMPIVAAPHHRLWLRFLCDERVKKLLIIAPPESAKTTWVISAFVGLYIGMWPERSVIIGSTSGPIAEKRAMSLRATVTSVPWAETFPHIKQAAGLVWRTNEWSLAPEGVPHPGRLHPTVAAYGTGGAVIGSRADLVLGDDLLDFENSRTSNGRNWVEQWMHRSLLSRRKSRTGRAVVVGTSWHHDDLYMHLKKDGGWIVIHTPLLAPESDGGDFYANITYPESWIYERLGEPVGDASLPAQLGAHPPRREG